MPPPQKRLNNIFSPEEMRDILIAIAALTIIFSYPNFLTLLPSAFIVVVTSFFLHELAHKFVAIKFGVKAFFKIWPLGIIAGLLFMFIPGVKFAAPGAVVIYSHKFAKWKRKYERYMHFTEITIKQVGIIAAAGPVVNVIIALVAWGMASSFFIGNEFLTYLVLINSWLAIINLIPVNPLDGSKIFTWKPWFWFLLIFFSGILLLSSISEFYLR